MHFLLIYYMVIMDLVLKVVPIHLMQIILKMTVRLIAKIM